MWPQGSSGLATLTKDERLRGMEVLATAIQGKKATLVLGVQGKDTRDMLEYARSGRNAGAGRDDRDAAERGDIDRRLPGVLPRARAGDEAPGHRADIGRRSRGLPPSTDLIVELAREFPNFGYVKEESAPVVERMKALVPAAAADAERVRRRIRSGVAVRMRLGLDGVITATRCMRTSWRASGTCTCAVSKRRSATPTASSC